MHISSVIPANAIRESVFITEFFLAVSGDRTKDLYIRGKSLIIELPRIISSYDQHLKIDQVSLPGVRHFTVLQRKKKNKELSTDYMES